VELDREAFLKEIQNRLDLIAVRLVDAAAFARRAERVDLKVEASLNALKHQLVALDEVVRRRERSTPERG
jgi:hypothetical protein